MFLHIRKLLRDNENPVFLEGELDLSGQDFPGFNVPKPVAYQLQAKPEAGAVRVDMVLKAEINALCARCLTPLAQKHIVEKQYYLQQEDLLAENAELPFTPDGRLDVQELAYQDLVMDIPGILLCSEDCPGLCNRCGKPAAQCNCPEQPVGDARLQILRTLIDEEN